ncbi:MAG: hypothetical protein B5M53_02045 [Candidatus Cloacimonas sp. 4484_209]|nr:MAG: hypothetical protein B5M53_02045 [Candidatus Cloacimonas sp. 4484_209]
MKKKLNINGKHYEIEIESNKNPIVVKINGNNYTVDLSTGIANGFRSIIVNNESFEVYCEEKDEAHFLLWIGNDFYNVTFGDLRADETEEEGSSIIHAPMPGLVAKLKVKENDKVSKGDPILILEAMKMQNEIKSPRDGIVKEIFVEEGAKVGLEDKLVALE